MRHDQMQKNILTHPHGPDGRQWSCELWTEYATELNGH